MKADKTAELQDVRVAAREARKDLEMAMEQLKTVYQFAADAMARGYWDIELPAQREARDQAERLLKVAAQRLDTLKVVFRRL